MLCDIAELSGYPFLVPEEQGKVHAAIERVFTTGAVESYETRMQISGRGILQLSTRVSPINLRGQVTSVTLISRDITEQAQPGRL